MEYEISSDVRLLILFLGVCCVGLVIWLLHEWDKRRAVQETLYDVLEAGAILVTDAHGNKRYPEPGSGMNVMRSPLSVTTVYETLPPVLQKRATEQLDQSRDV